MPFTVLLFSTRKPGITFDQFKTHYENTHVPMVKRLMGPLFPTSHTRHYIDKEGAPLQFLVGSPGESDSDCIAVLQFDNQEAMAETLQGMQDPEIASRLAEDEENFIDRSQTRIVVVGDAMVTERD